MSLRSQLVDALLPLARSPRVDRERPNLDGFWPRFDAVAPWHIQLALWVLAVGVLVVLPRIEGPRTPWSRRGPEEREALLARAEHLPLLSDLMEVGKLVACFAWFDEDDVQRAFRGDFQGLVP